MKPKARHIIILNFDPHDIVSRAELRLNPHSPRAQRSGGSTMTTNSSQRTERKSPVAFAAAMCMGSGESVDFRRPSASSALMNRGFFTACDVADRVADN